MVLANARERDASCVDVPATQRKTASSVKPRARAKAKDKNTLAKFEGECRHCGKKGHKWADCWKRLAEAKDKKVPAVDGERPTATVAAMKDTEVIDWRLFR